jgi:GGDEF domain-containing protein
VGYAVQTADLVHGDDLLRQADVAMYEAKRQRSGAVAFGKRRSGAGQDARGAELALG